MKIADVSNRIAEAAQPLNNLNLGVDLSQQMVKMSDVLENALKPLDTPALGKLS